MLIGTLLMKHASAYYSPTFGRGGLAAVFSCEVLLGTTFTLDIDIEHKNAEDTTFTLLGSFTQFAAAGVDIKNLTGIKEQVRFKYTVGGATASSFVHFNMLAPAWRPY